MKSIKIVIMSLIWALLAACAGPAVETPSPTIPPTVAVPTIAVASPTAPRATETVAPAAPTPTTAPTTAPTTGPVTGPQIAIQTADNAIKLVALDGSSTTLAQATSRLNPLNLNQPTNAISRTVYASALGPGVSPVALADANGVRPLDALKNPINGIALGTGDGGHLAWGRLVISGTLATTELFVGAPDGTKSKSVAKQSRPSNQEQRALTPFQWSGDGTRLYYSREPVGLGGYILFGGMTDLWVYSLKDGKSTQLVAEKQLGGQVCIDDISPNQKLVAFHCSGKSIGILDLATKKTSTIHLAPELPAVRALGNARFSADNARVAFAAARHDAENEQGWVLVSNGLTGNAKLIATSPAKDYYEVIAWLSLNTLLLQTHNPQPAVWTVRADGTGLQKLADGQFLSIVGNRP